MFGPHVERTNARYRLDNFLERQLVLEVLIKINNYELLPLKTSVPVTTVG